MAQTMGANIDEALAKQYLQRQGRKEYIRKLTDTLESVVFLPDSSLRFWYNDSMQSYEPHWHTALELIVPVEGNYLVTVSQHTYELSPGDIFLVPGGELHSLKAPSRGGRFILLFDFDQIWGIKGSAYLQSCMQSPLLINRSTCPSIYDEEWAILSGLLQDYLRTDSLRDITVFSRLLTFFLNYGSFRLSLEGGDPTTQLSHGGQRNSAEKFNAVFSYLDQHFAEDLTLESVAAVAGFSKFYFSRTFKQLSGSNFYDYLCHKRIRSSELLLMQPGLSISQIALQSGFSSLSTFNRTFKRMKGCTPTQYRGLFHVHPESLQEGETK